MVSTRLDGFDADQDRCNSDARQFLRHFLPDGNQCGEGPACSEVIRVQTKTSRGLRFFSLHHAVLPPERKVDRHPDDQPGEKANPGNEGQPHHQQEATPDR
jgi:hypothetical protein